LYRTNHQPIIQAGSTAAIDSRNLTFSSNEL
jgi:hypothetical protein